MRRLCAVAVGAALVALIAASGATASAPTSEVIAEGLDNPRGLAVAHDGTVLVAEAGRGGTGPCITGPEGEVV